MYKNPEMRTDEHMVNYIKDFEPLVRATAFRYYGRGAEIDDLLQEGYLALVTLIPKCPDMDYLPGFLKERLPAYVRNAAARLRHRNSGEHGEVLLEDIEETVGEQESRHKFSEAELSELLQRTLRPEELDMTQALLEGFSHREIAEVLGISQQAVTKRLKNIREKLKRVLDAL